MKTLNVRFVNGPFDGQSREIAIPPVKFEYGFELDADDNPVGWPNVPDEIGHYEQESISETLGYAVYVWVPLEDIPGCLKPLDAIEFSSQYDSHEPRRFAVAQIDTDGKIQWGWYWPKE